MGNRKRTRRHARDSTRPSRWHTDSNGTRAGHAEATLRRQRRRRCGRRRRLAPKRQRPTALPFFVHAVHAVRRLQSKHARGSAAEPSGACGRALCYSMRGECKARRTSSERARRARTGRSSLPRCDPGARALFSGAPPSNAASSRGRIGVRSTDSAPRVGIRNTDSRAQIAARAGGLRRAGSLRRMQLFLFFVARCPATGHSSVRFL